MRFTLIIILGVLSHCISCTDRSIAHFESASPPAITNAGELETDTHEAVYLRKLSPLDDKLRFELVNGSESSIWLSFNKEKTNGKDVISIPFELRCKASGQSSYTDLGPTFHFVPPLTPLNSGETVIFDMVTPRIRGDCVVSILYYADERAAKLVLKDPVGLSRAEKRFIDKSHISTKLRFDVY